MSIIYKCETCGYETSLAYNFERHKNKKIQCKASIAKPNEILKKPSLKLTNKFYHELNNKYNITHESLISDGWHYCGGDSKSHLNYFNLYNKNNKRVEKSQYIDKCVCGHLIKENCYITNKDNTSIIVVGNCCIKRFLPEKKKGRSCEDCGGSHRNRSVNLCNDCKYKKCSKCNKNNDNGYKICFNCYYN